MASTATDSKAIESQFTNETSTMKIQINLERRSTRRQTLTGRRKTIALEKLLADRLRELEMGPPKEIYEAKIRNYKQRDDKDVLSREPSYTNFRIPYATQCKLRYIKSKEKMEEKFQKELKQLEIFQPTAYSAVRLIRHIAITTLWPPLHNRREINRLDKFFEINQKQRKHLNY